MQLENFRLFTSLKKSENLPLWRDLLIQICIIFILSGLIIQIIQDLSQLTSTCSKSTIGF